MSSTDSKFMPMHDTTQPWFSIGIQANEDGGPPSMTFARRRRTPYDCYTQPELDHLADLAAAAPSEPKKPLQAISDIPLPQRRVERGKRPEGPDRELPAGFYGPSKRR